MPLILARGYRMWGKFNPAVSLTSDKRLINEVTRIAITEVIAGAWFGTNALRKKLAKQVFAGLIITPLMNYAKGILSALAASFLALVVGGWPAIREIAAEK